MTIAVLMCGDGVQVEDREFLAGSAVQVIDGLCRDPKAVTALGEKMEGLVLVVHADEFAPADVQAQIRAAGLDPLGVPMLDAAEYDGDLEGLRVAVAGSVARAEAFPGSAPAHAKPVFPSRLTRRSLFMIPEPAYIAAPAIDPMTCAAGDGCTACVGVCPEKAYEWVEGRIVYDKDRCEPCGRCVTTCPTGAISNPAATPRALAAQIEAMAVAADGSIGVAFRCGRAEARPLEGGWQVVEVPCTGMIIAPWALASLILGAAQVTVLPCSTTGCDRGLDAAAEDAVGFARAALEACGVAADRVALAPSLVVHEPLPAVPVDDPFGPRSAARVYAGLQTAAGTDIARITGDGATLGIVTIDQATCTMCTMCTQMCPTGALTGGYVDDGSLAISFDPGDCTACDQCVGVCPEVERGAIAVDHRVDFLALAAGRVELNRSETHTCERCGQPVAPTAMMSRIGDILGDEPALMDQLTRLCLACRGAS